jgi:hypothetical protein
MFRDVIGGIDNGMSSLDTHFLSLNITNAAIFRINETGNVFVPFPARVV